MSKFDIGDNPNLVNEIFDGLLLTLHLQDFLYTLWDPKMPEALFAILI